ncbi:MAG: T9SS type A sorting domain-containing protein [Candidatus Kapaibacterium sp.]
MGGPSGIGASDTILYRSTDGGVSWLILHRGGSSAPNFEEIDDDDRKSSLSVVGYGAIIYAGTEWGDFWKSTDGGDGTLSAAALAPRIEWNHGAFASGNDTLVVSPCSSSSTSVYYQNLSCAITKMDSISLIGIASNQYSLTSTHHNDCLSLPDSTYINFASIPPGTYPITVNAHFTDDEYNTIDTTLSFVLKVNAGGTTIPLNLHFKSSTITAHPGDTIDIPIYLSGNAALGATFITLPFGIDTNVLRPIGFQPAIPGMTVDSLSYGEGTGTVPLHLADLTLNGDTLIGFLRCVVYLADTLATSVTLTNAGIISVNAPCTALSITTDSVNVLITGCGTTTLLDFMKTGKIPLAIQSISPNPASNEIDVHFQSAPPQPISYQLIDALGKIRLSGATKANQLSLDASLLPEGIYFFRAETGDGFTVTRKVAIER